MYIKYGQYGLNMFITKVNSNKLEKINILIYSTDMLNRGSLVNLIKKMRIKNCEYTNNFDSLESKILELDSELLFLEIDIFNEKEKELVLTLKNDKSHRNIPLILITSEDDINNISYAKELGFDDYLLKPFNFPTIKELITDLVKKYDKKDTWYILTSIEKLIDDNNLDMALKYINSLEDKLNDFYLKYLKALYFFKKKQYKECIKELKLLLVFRPKYFHAHKLLAETYKITREKDKKLESLENVMLYSPKNPEHNFEIGKAYLENNNNAKAEKHLKYVEKVNPRHDGVHLNLANLYMKKGDMTKAQKYLKRLQKTIHSLSVNELNEIGMSLNQAGNKEEALEYFNRAWDLSKKENKKDSRLLFNLSSVYFEMEKYEKSLFYVNLAIKSKKNFLMAKKLKSRILLKVTLKNNE